MTNDETRPLLEERLDQIAPSPKPSAIKRTPLPWRQLSILFLIRFSEPVCATVVRPFVTEMIVFLGIANDPNKVGYYAGFINGSFSAAECLCTLSWGKASDIYGRKFPLIIGLFGSCIATLFFGFGQTFTMLLLARIINGSMACANISTNAMIGEITDDTNAARAFALPSVGYAIGIIVGPAIGGYLAQPAEQFPDVFGNVRLFLRYPYVFPCMVAAGVTGLGWLLTILCLKETNKSGRSSITHDTAPEDAQVPAPKSSPVTAWGLMSRSNVRRIMLGCTMVSAISSCQDHAWVLTMYTEIPAGGLGFSRMSIGNTLGLYGLFSVIIQLLIFPSIAERLGPVRCFRALIPLFAVTSLMIIWLLSLAKSGHDKTGEHAGNEMPVVFWTMVLIVLLKSVSNCAFLSGMVLVKNAAPTKNSLGLIHALEKTFGNAARAICPALASCIFALSATHNILGLGGQFTWILIMVLNVVAIVASYMVPDDAGVDLKAGRVGGLEE